jgi:hypothetical protein
MKLGKDHFRTFENYLTQASLQKKDLDRIISSLEMDIEDMIEVFPELTGK